MNNINYADKLKNISYVFKKRSITSIIGRSGSGKSLLSFILMDVIHEYDGEVLVNGSSDYDIYDYLRKVGYVYQNPAKHFICKNVKEEIAFGLRQYGYDNDKIDKQVDDALKLVNLDSNILSKDVTFLCDSEKVKVAIASSLVMNPEVLVLDEVTLCLDNTSKKRLLNLLLKLKNKFNKTIILISNDINFVYELGNDYLLLDDGVIVDSGKVNEIQITDKMFKEYGFEVPKVLSFSNDLLIRKNIRLNNVRSIYDIVKGVIDYD